MNTEVLLVDETNAPVGTAEKVEAHAEGWLHRAFSVFIFDSEGRLLLQKRHPDKYHSGGLWSNTCCSHPLEDDPVDAARRRLEEEMGFETALRPVFREMYHLSVGPGLVEHEYNHVFVGTVDRPDIRPRPSEVADWTWVSVPDLQKDLKEQPDRYTSWFPLLLFRALERGTRDENGRSTANP